MGAAVFAWGFGMAAIAWIVHCAWWRLHRPKDDLLGLAACMLLVPAVMALALFFSESADSLFCLLAWFLASALGTAYLFWYPAAQAVSPTMLVAILAGRARDKGIGKDQLASILDEEMLTGDTLRNLLHEQFAREDPDGHLHLLPRGRRTMVSIRFLRHLAGFSDPKG